MRILLIMDPGIPVPPALYGGHERLVYMFAEEYTKLGHTVTLLAGPDSHFSGTTYTFGENDLSRSKTKKLKEALFVWKFLRLNAHKFDVVHNFGRLIYLIPILNHCVKKVMTYGRPITSKWINLINRLPNRQLIFTACSQDCITIGNATGKWLTVYNAIDFSKYELRTEVDEQAPLMFLGRIEEVKGTHTAVKAALATNSKLLIAGNIEPEHQSYYEEQVKPFVDGSQIKYLGTINDVQKNQFLGQAKALLFPIKWDEPFGMVMVEAMACGTPVIGYTIGAVPEVIDEGVTGYKVKGLSELITAIQNISKIDRTLCRERAEQRFNSTKIAKDYINIFKLVSQA